MARPDDKRGKGKSKSDATSTIAQDGTSSHARSGAATAPSPSRDAPRPSANKASVPSACSNCKKAHLGCDLDRPCRRCVAMGKADTCVDVQHKKRGRPKVQSQAPTVGSSATDVVVRAKRSEGSTSAPEDPGELVWAAARHSRQSAKNGGLLAEFGPRGDVQRQSTLSSRPESHAPIPDSSTPPVGRLPRLSTPPALSTHPSQHVNSSRLQPPPASRGRDSQTATTFPNLNVGPSSSSYAEHGGWFNAPQGHAFADAVRSAPPTASSTRPWPDSGPISVMSQSQLPSDLGPYQNVAGTYHRPYRDGIGPIRRERWTHAETSRSQRMDEPGLPGSSMPSLPRRLASFDDLLAGRERRIRNTATSSASSSIPLDRIQRPSLPPLPPLRPSEYARNRWQHGPLTLAPVSAPSRTREDLRGELPRSTSPDRIDSSDNPQPRSQALRIAGAGFIEPYGDSMPSRPPDTLGQKATISHARDVKSTSSSEDFRRDHVGPGAGYRDKDQVEQHGQPAWGRAGYSPRSHNGIAYLISTNSLRCLRASPGTMHLLGMTEESLVGMDIRDLLHPEDSYVLEKLRSALLDPIGLTTVDGLSADAHRWAASAPIDELALAAPGSIHPSAMVQVNPNGVGASYHRASAVVGPRVYLQLYLGAFFGLNLWEATTFPSAYLVIRLDE